VIFFGGSSKWRQCAGDCILRNSDEPDLIRSSLRVTMVDVQSSHSLPVFRQSLKTFLFHKSFPDVVWQADYAFVDLVMAYCYFSHVKNLSIDWLIDWLILTKITLVCTQAYCNCPVMLNVRLRFTLPECHPVIVSLMVLVYCLFFVKTHATH